MKKIVICVSHRIDTKSRVIDCDLYLPVLCGAEYDYHNCTNIQPDNEGENISYKKAAYSELTVQYWMWKNISAEYYGLCHYRRYFNFAQRRKSTNSQNQIVEPLLNNKAIRRYRLDETQHIRNTIENCDAIFPESADVHRISTPMGRKSTVRELWEGYDGVFIKKADMKILLDTIRQLYPQYAEAAEKYLSCTQHIGYNCFIMRRHLFFEMCEFQFDILFKIESQLNMEDYSGNMKRTLGYMGEILFGIFSYHLLNKRTGIIKPLQLVYFEETRTPESLLHNLRLTVMAWLVCYTRSFSDLFLPIASKPRKILKNIIHWVRK